MNVTNSKTDVPPVDLGPMLATAQHPLAEDTELARYGSRIRQQGISMDITTDVSAAIARAKAPLQRDFPDWNIVHSDADRWWAFLAPDRRKAHPDIQTVDMDADTSEGLRAKLVEATS
jgi:hypothetical protein